LAYKIILLYFALNKHGSSVEIPHGGVGNGEMAAPLLAVGRYVRLWCLPQRARFTIKGTRFWVFRTWPLVFIILDSEGPPIMPEQPVRGLKAIWKKKSHKNHPQKRARTLPFVPAR
jgi:hypothetical protein